MKTNYQPHKSERGMATIETVPLMLIFVFLTCYSFGFFGIIHTGIMNSISARSHLFAAMRNRANVIYFRDTAGTDLQFRYDKTGARTSTVLNEFRPDDSDERQATERPIRVGIAMPTAVGRTSEAHNKLLAEVKDGVRYTNDGVNPAWITVSYGMCINTKCTDN
jgi:YD repeat-containing protein